MGRACLVCEAPAVSPFALCFCCATLVRQLRMPLVPVVALAEFEPGDALHRRLRGYKDAPVAERRAACAERLAAMLEAWLATGPTRGRLMPSSEWDLVATVPSSCRPAGDPVAALVGAVPDLVRRHRSLLVRGPAPMAHLRAARQGFTLRPGVDRRWCRGRKVAVVDDSLVTGARAQSAAAALRLGGAEVVGVVALGRLASARSRSWG
jgi:adenine/guanine phosphoribosyltransferase-like PRPP-binding protein